MQRTRLTRIPFTMCISPLILFGGKVPYRESDIEKLLAENYRKASP